MIFKFSEGGAKNKKHQKVFNDIPDLFTKPDLLWSFMDAKREPGKFELFVADPQNYEEQIFSKINRTDEKVSEYLETVGKTKTILLTQEEGEALKDLVKPKCKFGKTDDWTTNKG